ncbi:MAG: rane protein [Paenibacillaceae bacterium]|jgi:membrane protein DedA with SNARE-associated domain|nr:rane protein [Paenibacillaceae bacterium]
MGDIIHSILEFITGLGYWGILLGLAIEVIPSEIVLAYAGFLVYRGEINLVEAVIFGTIGCLLQQILLYGIGIYGGRPFVDKYGKYLHIKPKHIDLTERWFQKYGAGVVFTSRFIPVVRQAISIPAGIARMNLFKFLLYTGIASVPWAVLFVTLGRTLGENWESIDEKAGVYTQPILWGAIALIVLYILYKVLFRKKKPVAEAGGAGKLTVSGQLALIGEEYQVLNGRRISSKSDSQEFDHLAVGHNGIFYVETNKWGGTITLGGNGVERSEEGQQEDPTARLYRHEYVLKELLREHKIAADVVGILCFANPDSTIVGQSPAFLTVKPDQLVQTIRNYNGKLKLTASEVKSIAKLLEDSGASSH